MRQLLLVYDFPPIGGGIARWMGELARRFPAGSLIVSTGQQPESEASDRQFPNRIDRLPVPSRRLRTIQGLIRWSGRAVALGRSSDVGFTWCGNLKPAAYPARWMQIRLRVPYGIVLHGGDLLILRRQAHRSPLKRRTAAGLLRSASVLVTNSIWTATLCRGVLEELRVPPPQVHPVPLGTDPTVFRPGLDPSEVRLRYALDNRRWLLSVARLTPHKGIDTGIGITAQLRNRYPDLGYLVVGSGDQLAQLKELARQLGVADRVRFLVNVPDTDLAALYNCAEIYLGLSRELPERVEGFGISLLEASASGLPVLASRTGGIPEAVRDGETGLLVDPDQPDQISSALSQLLENPALASRLGAAGRRAVEEYYNWDRVAFDFDRIGRECFNRKIGVSV